MMKQESIMPLSQFTHLYPLSKTLRFELKPIGKTLEHIHTQNFLQQDEQLSDAYKEVKKLLDAYHRDFIEHAFTDVRLSSLSDCILAYQNAKKDSKDEKLKTTLEKAQDALRKEIVKLFGKDKATKERFARLFAQELFKGKKDEKADLAKWIIERDGEDSPQLQVIAKFERFTTYFTGFYENRKNMYTDEAKHTAIAYRLVHENLPRFLDNVQILATIKGNNPDLYQQLLELDSQVLAVFNEFSVESLLDNQFYQQLLTQTGITAYNSILGGKVLENGTKLQGVNEKINLYNQKHKTRIAKLKPLYKQILSDKQGLSFLPPKLADDKELCNAVNEFYRHHTEHLANLEKLLSTMADYQKEGIFVAPNQLATVSHAVYGNFALLSDALAYYYIKVSNPEFEQKLAKAKTDTAKDKLLKEQEKFIKSEHSLALLMDAVAQYAKTQDHAEIDSDLILTHFVNAVRTIEIEQKDGTKSTKTVGLIKDIHNKYSTIKGFLELERNDGVAELFKQKKSDDMHHLKLFLDSVLALIHFLKPLVVAKNSTLEKDERFYAEFLRIYDELSVFSSLYNKVRDYISQKPFSTEKFKLNFGNSTLLNGWDLNKEKDNFGIILRKGGYYYLALLDAKYKKVFEQAPKATSQDVYEKMVYKLLPGPNKMLPKVFFAQSNLDTYQPSKQLLEKYELGTHKKGDTFNLADCHALIDFFKASIAKHPEWKNFGFQFSPTSSYQDLSDFYREVEPQGYKLTFVDIDSSYIDELVEQGKLYLFQIYNKDFSANSYGNPNLHTLYFKELFSSQNLEKVVYKLNGEAEIFYRRASLSREDTTIHPSGELLKPKNPNRQAEQGRVLEHEVVKDKRYTQDKFLLHIPITLNFGVEETKFKAFNHKVNEALQSAKQVCVIGIDRGERHLLYLTVVNQQGKLLHQETLNDIQTHGKSGYQQTVPYHTLLDNKEKERANARINWGEIENIKELKSGYLSQVVHRIALLIREYSEQGFVPIIALEDLNFGFKRGRFKVEKQIYQNFENALIKKLNYLVYKDKKSDEIGGVRHALQLANKFEDVSGIGKQTGIIFYVPAWMTSKIDPTTGFVDLLKPKYENIAQSQAFFGQFDKICYNEQKDYFEFHLDYQKFTDKANGSQEKWVICSQGDVRYTYDNQTRATKSLHVTNELKALFDKSGIAYQTGENLVAHIVQSNEKSLYSGLTYFLRVLLAMRYSHSGKGEDFILSPVANASGQFFDSRQADSTLPQDADANGAYHIALKGLWMVEQIQSTTDLDKVDLKLTNKSWLNYAQKRF